MQRVGGIAAIVAALCATSAVAQQAHVDVYGRTQSDVVQQRNGALISSGAEFTLYELDVRNGPPRATKADDAARQMNMALPGDATSWPLPPAGQGVMLPEANPENAGSPRANTGTVATGCDGRTIAPLRTTLPIATNLARRSFYPLVRDAECRYGIPIGLMDSLILQESRYNPLIVSPKGAGGLSQLMPATAIGLGVGNRFDPRANVEGGARYLRKLLDQFGSIPLALAAYNAGPGSVMRAGGIPQNRETPGYVRNVLGLWTEPAGSLSNPTSSAHRMAVLLGFMTN